MRQWRSDYHKQQFIESWRRFSHRCLWYSKPHAHIFRNDRYGTDSRNAADYRI